MSKKETYRIQTGTDPMGNPVYRVDVIPENTSIPIEEAVKLHNNNSPKMSTDELIAEAKKIIDEKKSISEPVKVEPKPTINQIKRLSRLLQDYRNIK